MGERLLGEMVDARSEFTRSSIARLGELLDLRSY
jgi:hypothetical protein